MMGRPRVDEAEIVRLHQFGLSAAQIASQVGCSTRTVARVRRDYGLAQPRPENACFPVSQERLDSAAEMLADGAPRAEVCRTLGLHPRTVSKYFPGTAWSRTEVSRYARMVTELNKAIDGLALPNPKGTTK